MWWMCLFVGVNQVLDLWLEKFILITEDDLLNWGSLLGFLRYLFSEVTWGCLTGLFDVNGIQVHHFQSILYAIAQITDSWINTEEGRQKIKVQINIRDRTKPKIQDKHGCEWAICFGRNSAIFDRRNLFLTDVLWSIFVKRNMLNSGE